MDGALEALGIGGQIDCDRSSNVLANAYHKLLCEMLQPKFNGKRMVKS